MLKMKNGFALLTTMIPMNKSNHLSRRKIHEFVQSEDIAVAINMFRLPF
jgi:hypothetical protein